MQLPIPTVNMHFDTRGVPRGRFITQRNEHPRSPSSHASLALAVEPQPTRSTTVVESQTVPVAVSVSEPQPDAPPKGGARSRGLTCEVSFAWYESILNDGPLFVTPTRLTDPQ